MDGVKTRLQQDPLPRPASAMKKGGPINSRYQGCPSPVLLLIVVILHSDAL